MYLSSQVYKGETFGVRFRFSPQFPIDAPEVIFLVDSKYQPPLHGHVYSNGHVCLSILSSGWSPVLNVAAVLLSLQSMLASSTERKRPPDNDRYVKVREWVAVAQRYSARL